MDNKFFILDLGKNTNFNIDKYKIYHKNEKKIEI